MYREPQIPLSAVLKLIENQNAFNTQLIDKLGLYLVQAADKYDKALNPPVHEGPDTTMSYSSLTDESDDLLHQIESGIISPVDVTSQMRRMLADTETTIET